MKALKGIGAAIALTFVFASSALADCPVPGEVNTPPCSGAQITPDDPVASAEPSELATSNSAGVEISVTTLDVLLTALSIF